MFIDGFGISGYRGFGSKVQYIGPLNKVNIFIGQNNSGKSNILSFIEKYLNNFIGCAHGESSTALEFQGHELHKGMTFLSCEFAIGLKLGGKYYSNLLDKLPDNGNYKRILDAILKYRIVYRDGTSWFTFRLKGNQTELDLPENFVRDFIKARVVTDNDWLHIW